jgi:phenylalanyl-tRNA synthetase beta chain
MKFSLSWLKEHLDTTLDLHSLSDALIRCGHEVESISNPAAALGAFVVAEILHAERHPSAEKLQVCRVKTLQGELQIVCGAPNARAGLKVVLAPIGAIIPTNSMEIKPSKIRGVESQGMLCSARELGLGEDHDGIMEIAPDAALGTPLVDLLGLNDPIIDVAITANRGDCMSVYGIARDLAAAGAGTLKPLPSPSVSSTSAEPISIRSDVPDLCPYLMIRPIRSVKNAASPDWLQQRLVSAGLRPISALVDVTNYMTLTYGRPLHVYDAHKVSGTLHARRAREGESFDALNEKSYTLQEGMCVIADDRGVLGLGGIIGGAPSGVNKSTTDVLLECAYFDPASISTNSRKLGIDSDAKSRFERGIDLAFMPLAVEIATQMILDLCGGKAEPTVTVGTPPKPEILVKFDAAAVNALGGTEISPAAMRSTLTALGFTAEGNAMRVPIWRHDVTLPADLAEEVLRIHGYDAIPAVSLPHHEGITPAILTGSQQRQSRLRRILASRGLHETHTWGFVAPTDAEYFTPQSAALHLRNPISSELSVMRSSLLPHLVRGIARNQARGFMDVHLFEIGARFEESLPLLQEQCATIVRIGKCHDTHWQGDVSADFYRVKADGEAVLAAYGLDSTKVTLSTNSLPAYLHGHRAAALMLGPKTLLGVVGELHPDVTEVYGITGRVIVAELYLDRIPGAKPAKHKALSVSDFQAVSRDFAFVVDTTLPAATLLKAVRGAENVLLQSVQLFDVYQGKGLEENKKSLGIRVTLQARDRTLSESEIETVANAIVRAATSVGGSLR